MATIILDARHGGNDIGDAYGNRYEKDDNLRLTLAVGRELESYGFNVEYTRITDIYLSQYDRVQIINQLGGELMLSIHRFIGEIPIAEGGLEFFVQNRGGVAEETAINISTELYPLGFYNYSIEVISELPIIRDTEIPSLMMGIGYLNSESDNLLFDSRIPDIAAAIALGIYNTIPVENQNNPIISDNQLVDDDINSSQLYGVQIGLFSDYNNARTWHEELLEKGYMSQLVYRDPYYAVIVGAYEDLDTASETEFNLRLEGYNTLIVLL